MASGNFFKAALDKGAGPSLGYWQMMPSINISRMLAQTPGCDWVLIDCEHGDLGDRDMRQCVPAVAAAGASPIVRIPSTEPWLIKRALDAAKEARDIVKAAKFPSMGNRGFGSPFSMDRFKPIPTSDEYLQQANDSLLTLFQIETKSALDNLEEIAAVDGIDVLFIGPFDLGNSIGYPILNGVVKPELKAAIIRILEVSRKAGEKCGIYSASGE
ncbi:2 4-dihydroxyhept-2-ene-1 7-dioic acid aldolase [Fusarium mexicanum]|uniref:2 4-dihydroxyhept-2-ene-1 7-dioic acid aldolase n=1 Tax=Fusarium mexicanum TaxID=751941 RepID=A0A8H5IS00_9HYPO|nr:2 4-dihydroxyhept-2-ene-1 7-dioic acid aldolase [Fusarium mexicanum]